MNKGKISLFISEKMNGANLLYLLEKHGYKAKIDLKEAKEVFHEVKNK